MFIYLYIMGYIWSKQYIRYENVIQRVRVSGYQSMKYRWSVIELLCVKKIKWGVLRSVYDKIEMDYIN